MKRGEDEVFSAYRLCVNVIPSIIPGIFFSNCEGNFFKDCTIDHRMGIIVHLTGCEV